jgi:hypothetical protein
MWWYTRDLLQKDVFASIKPMLKRKVLRLSVSVSTAQRYTDALRTRGLSSFLASAEESESPYPQDALDSFFGDKIFSKLTKKPSIALYMPRKEEIADIDITGIFDNEGSFVGTIPNAADPFLVRPSWTTDVYLLYSDVKRKRIMAANLGAHAHEIAKLRTKMNFFSPRSDVLDKVFKAHETVWPDGRSFAYPSVVEFNEVMYGAGPSRDEKKQTLAVYKSEQADFPTAWQLVSRVGKHGFMQGTLFVNEGGCPLDPLTFGSVTRANCVF